MRGIGFVVLLSLLLTGCVTFSHDFYFMGRRSGTTGTATVPANGHHGGPITITLGGKVFEGRWVYVETGGSAGVGMTTATSATVTSTVTGTFVGLPTGGNGSVMAAAPDGSTLRCSFYFSEWNLKGSGVCQDNGGEIFDLQIS